MSEPAQPDYEKGATLLRDAVSDLLPMLSSLKWVEGVEGDGYRQSNAIFRTWISHRANFDAFNQAVVRVQLALENKRPIDIEVENAKIAVSKAQVMLDAALAKLEEVNNRV